MKRNRGGGIRKGLVLGLVVSAALLVPLAVYGAPALKTSAVSVLKHQYGSSCGQYGSSGGQYGASTRQYGSSCKQYKVTLCHRTHSKKHRWVMIRVNSRALKAHLRHGDTLPPCTLVPKVKHKHHGHGHGMSDKVKKHGKSAEHGKGHDKD